ncbi:MAG TPA: chemotaxis protein [Candidatus Omnitrophota bacterium]|nr:chemotaxis protein [Candidatus Omnitrophota bacterium]
MDETPKFTDILLETGTNELEIIEFTVGDLHYGINVAKVREIIRYPESIASVADAYHSLEGAMTLRGKVIPIINIAKHLKLPVTYNPKTSRIIISELNQVIVGFWVSSVASIHRMSWKQVEQPADLIQSKGGYVVAVIKLQEKIIFLLDFEKITADVNAKAGIMRPTDGAGYGSVKTKEDRATKTILVVEDSAFVRQLVLDHLVTAGYKTRSANNGEEAWNYLSDLTKAPQFKKVNDHIHLMISDIEMPQMDGLRLIKLVKEHRSLQKLPCIVFSSMISEELQLKCKSVGSDGEITKPQINDLVGLVDGKVL